MTPGDVSAPADPSSDAAPARRRRLPALPPRRVLVVAGLAVVLVLALVLAALAAGRAESAARPGGDTGPVLAGVELPADGGAGPASVVLSASAAGHPASARIADLLRRSVEARNAHDRAAWLATASSTAAAADPAAFAAATRSTRIGSVAVRRIDPVGVEDFVVPLDLVTTQDPADAPPDARVPRLCWQVSARVSAERGQLRLDDDLAGSLLRTPC